jgi:CRP-like cAMP-binding protein
VTTAGQSAALCRLLDLDPDLGGGIDKSEWESARHACRAELVRVRRGPWHVPSSDGARRDLACLLIIDGMLCREVPMRDRQMFELLGQGDVVHLPAVTGRPRLGGDVVFTAITEATVALLDAPFIRAAARWPGLLSDIHRRVEAQRDHLARQGLIAHIPKSEHRLLLALCHLADRWGYVTPAGTVLPVPLTHDMLGQLAAARRPTVTLAVSALEADGLIGRLEDGAWLLTPAGERMARTIAEPGPPGRRLGETLMLHRLFRAVQLEQAALRAESRQLLTRRPRARARWPSA